MDQKTYDATIAKFNRGGSDKLSAAHELIMSVHDYIRYLASKYFRLDPQYTDDIVDSVHLHLLNRIYLFNPKRGKFITWSRYHILNGLAAYYEAIELPVRLPRNATTANIQVTREKFIPNTNSNLILDLDVIDNRIDNAHIINRLQQYILFYYKEIDWLLFRDYFGLVGGDPMSLRQLRVKYNYNSWQAAHGHITKVIRFIRKKPALCQLLKELRS